MAEKIPSREECLRLLGKYGVPENIAGHSVKVAKVAVFLGKKLSEKGEKIGLPLLEAAALLHDIDKKICLNDPEKKHAVEGSMILEKEGLPKIAKIVEEHRLSHILERPFSSWESKLVYYADKRVKHDKIVSLEERFDYLLKRYGSISPDWGGRIIESKPKVFALEKEIFGKINADKSLRELE